jgi:hypothetical protein
MFSCAQSYEAELDDSLRNREILNCRGKNFLGVVNQSKKPAMPVPFRMIRSTKNRKKMRQPPGKGRDKVRKSSAL